MAKGDKYQDIQSINAGNYLDIQPTEGVEVTIHSLLFNSTVEIYFYDGSQSIGPIETKTGPGGVTGVRLHCTNGNWYRVKNTAATAQLIGYDGVQTK